MQSCLTPSGAIVAQQATKQKRKAYTRDQKLVVISFYKENNLRHTPNNAPARMILQV